MIDGKIHPLFLVQHPQMTRMTIAPTAVTSVKVRSFAPIQREVGGSTVGVTTRGGDSAKEEDS